MCTSFLLVVVSFPRELTRFLSFSPLSSIPCTTLTFSYPSSLPLHLLHLLPLATPFRPTPRLLFLLFLSLSFPFSALLSSSRPELAAAYKKDKPAAAARVKSAIAKIPVAPSGPTKSELKAAKKAEHALRKKRKLAAANGEDSPVDSDDEAPKGTGGKAHPEGELVDDLESDDFAFGSGSDDLMDELSSMSEWSDAPGIDGELSEEETDLGSDSEDEEGLWSDEDDDGGKDGEPAFDSEEDLGSLGSDEDGSSIFDSDLDDDEESDIDGAAAFAGVSAPKKEKKKLTADELEAAYEARPAKAKTPKPLPQKLPKIIDGKVVRSSEPLALAAAESSDEEEVEEVKERKEKPHVSDPLGQRFGRPAVKQLLEIKNKRERVQRAREEIADLGREAAGTGEGEGGVRFLFLLFPRTFLRHSFPLADGRNPVEVCENLEETADAFLPTAQPHQASSFPLRSDLQLFIRRPFGRREAR